MVFTYWPSLSDSSGTSLGVGSGLVQMIQRLLLIADVGPGVFGIQDGPVDEWRLLDEGMGLLTESVECAIWPWIQLIDQVVLLCRSV